jgi:membrane protease YdiL (CAAX protease family)
MAQFGATIRVAPQWFALFIIGLYVAGEEIVFRGVLVNMLRPAGALLAVAVPTAVFAGVQMFHMPTARAAIFPVAGALVVGTVHGIIYLLVPALLPLMLAHAVFVVGAVTIAIPSSDGSRR